MNVHIFFKTINFVCGIRRTSKWRINWLHHKFHNINDLQLGEIKIITNSVFIYTLPSHFSLLLHNYQWQGTNSVPSRASCAIFNWICNNTCQHLFPWDVYLQWNCIYRDHRYIYSVHIEKLSSGRNLQLLIYPDQINTITFPLIL